MTITAGQPGYSEWDVYYYGRRMDHALYANEESGELTITALDCDGRVVLDEEINPIKTALTGWVELIPKGLRSVVDQLPLSNFARRLKPLLAVACENLMMEKEARTAYRPRGMFACNAIFGPLAGNGKLTLKSD